MNKHIDNKRKYTCPMHPEIVQDKPGNCPKCGMTLVLLNESENNSAAPPHQHDANPLMGHAGHNHHAMMIADFRKRFYVVLILTIPLMLLSEMIQHWLNIQISFLTEMPLTFNFQPSTFNPQHSLSLSPPPPSDLKD